MNLNNTETMDSNITYTDANVLNNELRSHLLPVTGIVATEAVLGFVGNLVVLLVFLLRYHVCNFRYFVLCLALTDVIASCTAISGEVVTQLYWYVYPFPAVCKAKSFFNVFTVFAETFCLLTIAVDRYRKVCCPLGWQIRPRVALILCGIIYLLSAIIAIPVAIFWGTHSEQLDQTDRTVRVISEQLGQTNTIVNVTVCEIDQRFLGQSDPQSYTYCLEAINGACLLPMLILYVFVARALIKSSKLKEKRRATSKVKAKPRNNNKSDTEYTTDDDSKLSSVNTLGANARKVLPSKPSSVKLEDIDTSTANSNTTSQTGVNTTETASQETYDLPNKPKLPKRDKKVLSNRVRRKTLIMFVLTVVFIITTVTYITMLGLIAGNILDTLSSTGKAVYFFFFRFYFVNHVINPLVYGLMDPQFRRAIGDFWKKVRGICSRLTRC